MRKEVIPFQKEVEIRSDCLLPVKAFSVLLTHTRFLQSLAAFDLLDGGFAAMRADPTRYK